MKITKTQPSDDCIKCQHAQRGSLLDRLVGKLDNLLVFESKIDRRLALALSNTRISLWGPGNSNRDSLFSFVPIQREQLTAASREAGNLRKTGRGQHKLGLGTSNRNSLFSFDPSQEGVLTVARLEAVDDRMEGRAREESKRETSDSPSHTPTKTIRRKNVPVSVNPSSTTDDRERLPSRQKPLKPTSSLSQSDLPPTLRIGLMSIKRKPVPLPTPQGSELGFGLDDKPEQVGLKRQSAAEVASWLIPGGPESSEDVFELPADTPVVGRSGNKPPTLPLPDYSGSSFGDSWEEYILSIPNDWSWVDSDTDTDTDTDIASDIADTSSDAGARDIDEDLHGQSSSSSLESASLTPWEARPEYVAYLESLFLATRKSVRPPTRFEDFEIPLGGMHEQSLPPAIWERMPMSLSFSNRALLGGLMNVHRSIRNFG